VRIASKFGFDHLVLSGSHRSRVTAVVAREVAAIARVGNQDEWLCWRPRMVGSVMQQTDY
jgi:hypothetical protein